MWRQIRGLGLSYHYSMYVDTDTGLLRFILFKSTHVANAYKVGKEIVVSLRIRELTFGVVHNFPKAVDL